MKKFVRWVVIGLVVLAVVLGILMIPSVQRAIVVKVASGEGRSISMEYFRVGFGKLRIENLEYQDESVLARVPDLAADFSWRDLLGKKLVLRDFKAEDLYVRLQKSSMSGEEEVSEEKEKNDVVLPSDFDGLLGRVVPAQIQNLSIGGVLSTPENDEISFSIQGENVEPGGSGELRVSVVPEEGASETIPSLNLRVPVKLGADGVLQSIALRGEVESRMPTARGSLQLDGTISPQETGEGYDLSLQSEELMAGGAIRLNGEWNRATREISLNLGASGENLDFLQPFVDATLPDLKFEVRGATQLKAGSGLSEVDLQVNAVAAAGTVPELDEPIQASGVLSISQVDHGLSLNQMDLKIGPTDGAEWFAIKLLGAQTFREGESIELPQGAFATVDVYLPARIAESFTSDWTFSDLKGSVQVEGRGDDLLVEPKDAFTISIGRRDRGGAQSLISVTPSVVIGDGEVKVEKLVKVASSEKLLELGVEGSINLDAPLKTQFEYGLAGDLSAIVPVLPAAVDLESGKVDGHWKLNTSEAVRLSGTFGLQELVAMGRPETDVDLKIDELEIALGDLPSASLRAGIDLESEGHQSYVHDLAAKVSHQENERWKVAIDSGEFSVDEGILGGSGSKVGTEGSGVSAKGSSPVELPLPAELNSYRELPEIPVDIETISVAGKWIRASGGYEVGLEVADLLPGEEGTLRMDLREVVAGGGGLSGSLNAVVRVDAGAAPRSISGTVDLQGVEVANGAMGLVGDFTFSPQSPVDPIVLNVRSAEGTAPLLALRGNMSDEAVVITADSDAAVLLRTPLRNVVPNLATGQFKAEASLLESGVSLKGAIRSLTPLDGFESFDVTFDGSLETLAPLAFRGTMLVIDEKDYRSDVNLDVSGDLDSDIRFELKGKRLDLSALQRLGAVFAGDSQPVDHSEEVARNESDGSAWPLEDLPLSIRGAIQYDEFLMEGMPSIDQIIGEASADRDGAVMRIAGNWFEDSSFSGEARIAKAGEKVEGTVEGRVTQLPVGELLRELNPKETAPLEGVVDLGVSFDGAASSLSDLPNWMIGSLEVTVKDGVIRSLKPEARVTRMIQAGSLASVIAGSKLKRPGIAALGVVVSLFEEIPFTSFSAKLERNEARETVISSVQLLGDYLYLGGSGKVDAGDLDDLSTTPMKIDLELGSKEPLTEQLEILGLLATDSNSKGYRKWKKPVSISGTFSEPDTSDLWDLILGAVERAATLSKKDLQKERENAAQGTNDSSNDTKKKKDSTEDLIEQGVNRLFDALKL